MKHQDKFKKKYGIDAIDFVEKADLEYFGLAKTNGIQSVLKSYAEKKGMNIEFNDEFNKDLVEAFAEANKKFPYNEKITFKEEIYQLEPTPVNPSIPKSKGVLEDFKDIVGNDPFRENFNGVYVSDDGFLYGTDAHKLIKYKNNDYSEYAGKLINLKVFIDSKGRKLDFVDARPLQYETVIPKNNPEVIKNLPTYNFYNFAKSVVALKKLLSSDIFNVIFDFKGELFGFNPILMSDVFHFALCKGFDTFTLEYSTPNRAIIFNFKDDSLGLLMPIMVKEDSLMGTTKTTIEQIVSDYGYSKSMPKAKSEKATKVEVKEVPYKKFEGSMNQTVYVPRRDISYLVLRNGEQLSGNDIIDGVYKIKKMAHGGNVGKENAEMVMSYNKQIAHHTKEMNEAMSKKGEVPAWVVAKMTRSASDLSDATHFMEGKGESYATGGGVGDKKEMKLYRVETLAKGNKDVLTDRDDNLYIYEKGILYNTEDGNNKGTSLRMSKIDLTILPYKEYARGGAIGDNVHITDEKSLMNNKSGVIIGDEGTFWLVKTLNGTGLVKKSKVKVIEDFATGGSIGFIPMDVEEDLAITAKWGGTDIKGVIGILNAMIDSGLADEDLKPKPTKTGSAFQKATENKTKEIWAKIEPKYKGDFKGNMYYSTISRLVQRANAGDNILKRFKPFRKNQNFANGGGVGEPYDSMTKYQLDKEYKKLNEKRDILKKKYGKFDSSEIVDNEKQIDKIITLLYGENFSGVGQKYKYADGGGVGNTFYALTSNGMQNKRKQKIQSISYWKGRQSTHKPTSENINEFLSQVPFDEKICIYTDDDDSFYGQLHSAHVPLYTNGAKSVDAIVDNNNNIIWNKYAGSKYEIKIENYKMETGGGITNEIAEIKAKIEKAKNNTIMPENLKKQYIEKYENQLAALTLDKGTKEDVKDFLEVPKGKTPKIVKVEPKGRVKLKEILIHWAEGDNSKYDKFPKKYKTWEAANKAIIPIYEDYAEEGGGGYNKVKFTVTFDDNENYDGRLDVSTKEDNPTKTHNVVGQHIKDYLDYQLSEKSRTSEAVKKEILEWLEKYDLGLEKNKLATKKEHKELNQSDNYDLGYESIMKKTLVSPKGNEVHLSVTYYPENKNLKYRIYLAGNPEKAYTNKAEMEKDYNKLLESYNKKNYTVKQNKTEETTKVSKNYDYIPQRDIEQIKAKQGTIENKDILDGAYIKKGWKHKK